MSASSIDKRLEEKCSAAVLKLVEPPLHLLKPEPVKINFLAIDFDQTMINIHTGGRWKGTVTELVEHMRPLFLHLIPIASRNNIRVAVVTFSCQTDRIREVLEMSFPEWAELIPIRGCDKTWRYEGSGMRMGKQHHIASVVEELMTKPALGVVDIGKVTTLLIDDDPRNIRICLKDGVRAVWFNPLEPDRLLDNILLLK